MLSIRFGLIRFCVLRQVWKARHFLVSTDGAQQAYLTAALVACLRRMDKHTLEVRAAQEV